MTLCKVIGSVISTRKIEGLIGSKFMVVESLNEKEKYSFVAVDSVGAGIGEIVLVSIGSSARRGNNESVIDALIVGIVDNEC